MPELTGMKGLHSMAKKSTLTVTLPDGKKAFRQTSNAYSHVVVLRSEKNGITAWDAIQWCKSELNAQKAINSAWWSKNLHSVMSDGYLWQEFLILPVATTIPVMSEKETLKAVSELLDRAGIAPSNCTLLQRLEILVNDANEMRDTLRKQRLAAGVYEGTTEYRK